MDQFQFFDCYISKKVLYVPQLKCIVKLENKNCYGTNPNHIHYKLLPCFSQWQFVTKYVKKCVYFF